MEPRPPNLQHGPGVLSFPQRHCPYCLTRRLSNGEILFSHPVLEAKLVTANGFVFSLMTEFIENADLQGGKQDCELKAFYRLAKRLKVRFPRLPICLLLDGLYAGGPTFRLRPLSLREGQEQADAQQEKLTKYLWLTNFPPTSRNVDTLANQGGRLRWKIEHEGVNVHEN